MNDKYELLVTWQEENRKRIEELEQLTKELVKLRESNKCIQVLLEIELEKGPPTYKL